MQADMRFGGLTICILSRVLNISEHRDSEAAYKRFKGPARDASTKTVKEKTLQHSGFILPLHRPTQQHTSVFCPRPVERSSKKMPPTTSFLTAVANRHSNYTLLNESPITNSRILEIVHHALAHGPSPFNVRSARCLILFRDHHTNL